MLRFYLSWKLSVENVQKCGGEKEEIPLDKQGRKLIIWIKEKRLFLSTLFH